MGAIQSHKDLIVWQKSMDLVEIIYVCTKDFPRDEIYGLTSQMRRSAISIPSNIAEGRRRTSKKDYNNFLAIALGSATELETQLEIAKRLGFGNPDSRIQAQSLCEEILKMLMTMSRSLHPIT
jgi:four helix bundle protein